MTFELGERVKETTTTTGTGTLSLAGAATGFRTFVAEIGSGNTCEYLIDDGAGNWELGIGTVTDASPDTLSRNTVLKSSNADVAVSFGAGSKTVVVPLSAYRMIRLPLEVPTAKTNNYTAVLADQNSYIRMNKATAVTFTIPTEANVAFPIGTTLHVENTGAGAVTIAGESGVTLNADATSPIVMADQYTVATGIKTASDTWTIFGALIQ